MCWSAQTYSVVTSATSTFGATWNVYCGQLDLPSAHIIRRGVVDPLAMALSDLRDMFVLVRDVLGVKVEPELVVAAVLVLKVRCKVGAL